MGGHAGRMTLPAARWTPSEPTTAADAVAVPKQTGEQGFYKVWVSDAPIFSAPHLSIRAKFGIILTVGKIV